MISLTDVLLHNITEITEEDLKNVSKIGKNVFDRCDKLISVTLPENIEKINSFGYCPSLIIFIAKGKIKEIDENSFTNNAAGVSKIRFFEIPNIDPYCILSNSNLDDSPWYTNQNKEYITLGDGKILFGNKVEIPKNLTIPSTIINLGTYSCKQYPSLDSSISASKAKMLIEFTIPDTVELIQDNILHGHQLLTKIVVGKSVKKIGYSLAPTTAVTTVVFRQPEGMYIELPESGNGTGIFYNKSSRAVSIYTDNEYIKNYDWAGDNVTPTFYSLSEAPV